MQFGDWVVLDWSNVPGLFDWFGLALAVAGFWIAIRQLQKSRSALVAAEETLKSAKVSFSTNQLIGVLPAFEEISNQLNVAVRDDLAGIAEVSLVRFQLKRSEALALMRLLPERHQTLIPSFNRVGNVAQTAYSNLFSGTLESTADRVGLAARDLQNLVYEIRTEQTNLLHAVPTMTPENN